MVYMLSAGMCINGLHVVGVNVYHWSTCCWRECVSMVYMLSVRMCITGLHNVGGNVYHWSTCFRQKCVSMVYMLSAGICISGLHCRQECQLTVKMLWLEYVMVNMLAAGKCINDQHVVVGICIGGNDCGGGKMYQK